MSDALGLRMECMDLSWSESYSVMRDSSHLCRSLLGLKVLHGLGQVCQFRPESI